MSPERLVVIRPDRSEFIIGPLPDAAPLAYAFLTDSDVYAVRIERAGESNETTRQAWQEIERLAHPESFEEVDGLGGGTRGAG